MSILLLPAYIVLISFQIDHIFLSRVCSETAGGLPGLFPDFHAINVYGLVMKGEIVADP